MGEKIIYIPRILYMKKTLIHSVKFRLTEITKTDSKNDFYEHLFLNHGLRWQKKIIPILKIISMIKLLDLGLLWQKND